MVLNHRFIHGEAMPAILHHQKERKGSLPPCRTGSAELELRVKCLQVEVGSLRSLLDSILLCLRAHADGGSSYSIDTILEAIMQEICRHNHQAPEIQ
jgi:hypothetical protein